MREYNSDRDGIQLKFMSLKRQEQLELRRISTPLSNRIIESRQLFDTNKQVTIILILNKVTIK